MIPACNWVNNYLIGRAFLTDPVFLTELTCFAAFTVIRWGHENERQEKLDIRFHW